MNVACCLQRLHNLFRDVMHMIRHRSAEADSRDGVRWQLHLSNDEMRDGLEPRVHVQTSDIRYGHWSLGGGSHGK